MNPAIWKPSCMRTLGATGPLELQTSIRVDNSAADVGTLCCLVGSSCLFDLVVPDE